MTLGIPFVRGFEQVDGYAAATALSRLFQLDYSGAADALSTVVPMRFLDSFTSSPVIPASAIFKGGNLFVIAVVGTQNNTQLALDVVGSAQVPIPPFPGRVGAYWALAAQALWSRFLPVLLPFPPGSAVALIGHSLGGAIAMCLYHLAARDLPTATPIQVTTFGASKPGDPAFASVGGGAMFRWENRLDPVVSIPPPLWNPVGALWPVSGPAPFTLWDSPGSAATIEANGTISGGSDPPSTVAAANMLATGQIDAHLITEYARRLRITLTDAQLSPPVSGFENPVVLDEIFGSFFKDLPMAISSPRLAPGSKTRVYISYTYGATGPSEEFFTSATATQLIQSVIRNYLYARFRMAVDLFRFNYARITNPANPRWVDFVTPDTPGIPAQGYIPTNGVNAVQGSDDTSALLLRMKLATGPSARIFLHGYDGSMGNQGEFRPNGTFTPALLNFIQYLTTGADDIEYQYAAPPVTPYIPITSVTPIFPRGATIVPAVAQPTLVPGQTLNFVNIGSQMQGLAGRKIVSSVVAGGTSFNIGGASPVGSYLNPNAAFYLVNPQYSKISYGFIERITEHKVGRPFGAAVGRKKNRLPLRR